MGSKRSLITCVGSRTSKESADCVRHLSVSVWLRVTAPSGLLSAELEGLASSSSLLQCLLLLSSRGFGDHPKRCVDFPAILRSHVLSIDTKRLFGPLVTVLLESSRRRLHRSFPSQEGIHLGCPCLLSRVLVFDVVHCLERILIGHVLETQPVRVCLVEMLSSQSSVVDFVMFPLLEVLMSLVGVVTAILEPIP